MRLRAHPGFHRTLERPHASTIHGRADVLMIHGAELDAGFEDGTFAVTAPEVLRERIAHGGRKPETR